MPIGGPMGRLLLTAPIDVVYFASKFLPGREPGQRMSRVISLLIVFWDNENIRIKNWLKSSR